MPYRTTFPGVWPILWRLTRSRTTFQADEYEFKYDLTRSEMESIAQVSNIARQDVLVDCKNTVAYYNQNANDDDDVSDWIM